MYYSSTDRCTEVYRRCLNILHIKGVFITMKTSGHANILIYNENMWAVACGAFIAK